MRIYSNLFQYIIIRKPRKLLNRVLRRYIFHYCRDAVYFFKFIKLYKNIYEKTDSVDIYVNFQKKIDKNRNYKYYKDILIYVYNRNLLHIGKYFLKLQ